MEHYRPGDRGNEYDCCQLIVTDISTTCAVVIFRVTVVSYVIGMKLTGKTIILQMHKIYFILSEHVNYCEKKGTLNDCFNEILYGLISPLMNPAPYMHNTNDT